jgi:glutathionylspermidine synthase
MSRPIPYRLSDPLSRETRAEMRRRAIFECGKWDPQIGDHAALATRALLLEHTAWGELVELAQRLATETLAAEQEIALRPELHSQLGLPRPVRRAMRLALRDGLPASAARVMRFDFHWTPAGWRVSEVNSDVPGGFVEASAVTRLMSSYLQDVPISADPTDVYAAAIRDAVPPGGMIALVHATAYSDDRQVMVHLESRLRELGLRTALIAPDQLIWRDGRAELAADWQRGPVDLVLRFFPGEWLPSLSRSSGWRHFYAGSKTPLSNPATALVTQSKRFPLVWDRLSTPMDTWRALMPETRDPRHAPWRREPERWVLKPALGRVGDAILMTGVTPAKEQRQIRRSAYWRPQWWVAQAQFETMPAIGDDGEKRFPCLGVYTIDGRAAGIYGRMSSQPLINQYAQDVAVLIDTQLATKSREEELICVQ